MKCIPESWLPILEALPLMLTTAQYAELVQKSKDRIAKERISGDGPPFVKLGRGRTALIRYRRDAVVAWLAARERLNTSEITDMQSIAEVSRP